MPQIEGPKKQCLNIPEDLRKSNTRLILSHFMARNSLSISDLEQLTGISKTTIIKIINTLLEGGVILDEGKAKPSVEKGRRPNIYKLNANHRLFVSMQLFPSGEIYTAVTNLKSEILCTMSEPITNLIEYGDLLAKMENSIRELLSSNDIPLEKVDSLVIASSGPTNHPDGTVIYSPRFPNLPRQMRFKMLFHQRFPEIPNVIVENELRLQALAEQNLGKSSSLNLVLEAGDKLVASLVDRYNNQIRGTHSIAGEIGHMTLDPYSDVQCVCGAYGCFLALVTTSRVLEMVEERIGDYPDTLLREIGREVEIADVFQGYNAQDPLCNAIMDDIARWFGQGLANIVLMLDPHSIVIQGVYTKAGPRFLASIKEQMVKNRYPLLRELGTTVAYSSLGKDAGVLGGSIFAVNQFLSSYD